MSRKIIIRLKKNILKKEWTQRNVKFGCCYFLVRENNKGWRLIEKYRFYMIIYHLLTIPFFLVVIILKSIPDLLKEIVNFVKYFIPYGIGGIPLRSDCIRYKKIQQYYMDLKNE